MARLVGSNSKYLEKRRSLHKSAAGLYGFSLYVFFFLGAVISIVGLVLHYWAISLLALIAMVVCYVVQNLQFKHENNAHQFYQGQKGEWEVKTELSKLPENYVIFCDVKFFNKNYNIDFVLSGPTGIFAIEVKSHKGHIKVSSIYERYFGQVLNGALKIREYLKKSTGKEVFIKAVLVYSNDEAYVKPTLANRNIHVIHKNDLNEFIKNQRDISKEYNIFEFENHLTWLTSHNIK